MYIIQNMEWSDALDLTQIMYYNAFKYIHYLIIRQMNDI